VTTSPANLVVMISGNGSNLQAILDACSRGDLYARVVAVISNQPDAYGIIRAQKMGVASHVCIRKKGTDRRIYDSSLADLVESLKPDWVILAGWMLLLSSAFLDRFPNRVVNLHPALPGMFPGTHAIERAYACWQKGEIDHTGVMLHLVPDEGVDLGPVLAKEVVPILASDTLETLEARIHDVEHRLLVNTLCQILKKK
jgi:phosphoribosylglycinamide formyltransferase-1